MRKNVLLTTALLAMAVASTVFAGGSAMWSYEGKTGPKNWGNLSPDWSICGDGHYQSPIDIKGGVPATLGALTSSIKPTPLSFGLDGPTFAVEYEKGSWVTVNNTRYEVLQFHFHHTSEHTVNGSSFPMEAHVVMRSESSPHADAVLGTFIEAGAENAMLNQFWSQLPRSGKKKVNPVPVNVGDLLPQDKSYYMYEGSMTTPGCPQSVRWFVFQTPVQASEAQIKHFIDDFTAGSTNNRPIQPLYGRVVLKSN